MLWIGNSQGSFLDDYENPTIHGWFASCNLSLTRKAELWWFAGGISIRNMYADKGDPKYDIMLSSPAELLAGIVYQFILHSFLNLECAYCDPSGSEGGIVYFWRHSLWSLALLWRKWFLLVHFSWYRNHFCCWD